MAARVARLKTPLAHYQIVCGMTLMYRLTKWLPELLGIKFMNALFRRRAAKKNG